MWREAVKWLICAANLWPHLDCCCWWWYYCCWCWWWCILFYFIFKDQSYKFLQNIDYLQQVNSLLIFALSKFILITGKKWSRPCKIPKYFNNACIWFFIWNFTEEKNSYLRDNNGAAFLITPKSGSLSAYGSVVIQVSAIHNMWGQYSDTFCCQVNFIFALCQVDCLDAG